MQGAYRELRIHGGCVCVGKCLNVLVSSMEETILLRLLCGRRKSDTVIFICIPFSPYSGLIFMVGIYVYKIDIYWSFNIHLYL